MSDDLRQQIRHSLDLKETEDLVEIWRRNERFEWSDTAFEAIREILIERLGAVPAQNEPVFEQPEEIDEELDLEMDEKDLPVLYKPEEILRLERWISRAAIFSIAATFISSLIYLPRMVSLMSSYTLSLNEMGLAVAWVLAILVFLFTVALQSILIYFPLKALGTILITLMEMEFNSRGVKLKID